MTFSAGLVPAAWVQRADMKFTVSMFSKAPSLCLFSFLGDITFKKMAASSIKFQHQNESEIIYLGCISHEEDNRGCVAGTAL